MKTNTLSNTIQLVDNLDDKGRSSTNQGKLLTDTPVQPKFEVGDVFMKKRLGKAAMKVCAHCISSIDIHDSLLDNSEAR